MQTTAVVKNPPQYRVGRPVGLTQNKIDTYTNEDATALTPGTLVIYGTDPQLQVLLPTVAFASINVAGVVVYGSHKSLAYATPNTGITYETDATVDILREGDVPVYTTRAVTAGSRVYVLNAGTPDAQFTDVTDAATATPINAVYDTSTTAAGIAVIRLVQGV